jgi:hypothetical protein
MRIGADLSGLLLAKAISLTAFNSEKDIVTGSLKDSALSMKTMAFSGPLSNHYMSRRRLVSPK